MNTEVGTGEGWLTQDMEAHKESNTSFFHSSKLNSAPVAKMLSHTPHTGHKEEKGCYCHVYTASNTATTRHSSPSPLMIYFRGCRITKVQDFTSILTPVPALHAARPVLSTHVSSINPNSSYLLLLHSSSTLANKEFFSRKNY